MTARRLRAMAADTRPADADAVLDALVDLLAARVIERLEAADRLRAEAPPDLLPVDVAAARLGIARTSLYHLIGRGEIRAVKAGRRRLIPDTEVDRWIAERMTGSA